MNEEKTRPNQNYIDNNRAQQLLEKWSPVLDYTSGKVDKIEDAQKLVQFAKVSACKINLIEYNTVDGLNYKKSSNQTTNNFVKHLENQNLIVNLRRSKGKDIAAACGQLVNKLQ